MDYDFYGFEDKPKDVEEEIEEEEFVSDVSLEYLGEYEPEEEEEEEHAEFYEISAKLTIRLQQTFQYFDKEKNEYLPTKMIGTLMRFVGFTPTEADIKYAIKCLRLDPRGTIDFQKFFQVVQIIARDPEPDEDIIQAFSVFDEEKKGWIPAEELRQVLTTQGDKLKEEEIVELIKIADKKKKGKAGDGKIRYENFMIQLRKMLKKMPIILECDQPPPPDPRELLKMKQAAAAKKKKK